MNLWPVEHFCPHFFFQISIPKYVTSYKIHILDEFLKWLSNRTTYSFLSNTKKNTKQQKL